MSDHGLSRPIYKIAHDISKAWKNPPESAKVYLDAMLMLTSVTDHYFLDPAKDIIIRFLSNAQSFRGAEARTLKAELKELL